MRFLCWKLRYSELLLWRWLVWGISKTLSKRRCLAFCKEPNAPPLCVFAKMEAATEHEEKEISERDQGGRRGKSRERERGERKKERGDSLLRVAGSNARWRGSPSGFEISSSTPRHLLSNGQYARTSWTKFWREIQSYVNWAKGTK